MVWEEVKAFGNVFRYFWKTIFTRLFSLFHFKLTLKWLWNFRLPIISISYIWIESSALRFVSAAFIENLKLHRSGTKPPLHIQESLRGVLQKFQQLHQKIFRTCRNQHTIIVAPRSGFLLEDGSEYHLISISFNRLLLAVRLIASFG